MTTETNETSNYGNRAPNKACDIEVKQHLPGKQLILMTDACLRSTGYALMIENNPDQKIQWNRKNYAPVAFESKNFCPSQRKKPYTQKKSWQYT